MITADVPQQQRAQAAQRLDQAMALQGLMPARRLTFGEHTLQTFRKRATEGGGEAWCDPADPERFVAACGTLIARGRAGIEALRNIAEHGLPDPRSSELLGGFCLLRASRDGLELRTDPLGLLAVYRDRAGSIWSSSFLALASAIGARRLSTQAVYEYVFSEQPHGHDALVEEIERHDCRSVVTWSSERRSSAQISPQPPEPRSDVRAQLLDATADALRAVFAGIGSAFADRVDSGLSGGYDSRLVLAGLRSAGVTPHLHVYGAAQSDDVRIAKEVAAAAGLPLKHTDKSSAQPPAREDYLRLASSWLHAFDGYPADGIMGNGQDLATREARLTGGRLALNGGGGEIFRNFFYLPDGTYTRRDILWSFYSQFDPRMATSRFSESDYYARLEEKLANCVGHTNPRLTRREVEWLYTTFRCRFWMGRNNSVNNRLGYYLTPLVAWPLVMMGLEIPLREKNHGRFESRLIARLAPQLAKVTTAYGHDLLGPVPARRILKDYTTLLRPPALRRWSFRLQARAAAPANPAWRPLAEFGLGSPPERMSQYFHVDRVTHAGQLNRIYTLELLARTLDLS